jgi:GTP-binding protein EngB required for normal cell division
VPYVHDPSVINVLLIGRSQVGKSTLIEVLHNPDYSTTRTGISQTREPSCKERIIDYHDGKRYTLNIIDTPGLYEVRHDPNEMRTNEQLFSLLRDIFVSGRVRALNIICFVTIAGKTHQNDIETFTSLINFLGDRYKPISCLVLTHCDKISTETLDRLSQDIKTHPECASIVDYCQLGIHYHGTIDMDDLSTYDEEMREMVKKSTLKRIDPMRTHLLDFFLSRSNNYVQIELRDFEPWEKSFRQPIMNQTKLNKQVKEVSEYLRNNHILCCTIL